MNHEENEITLGQLFKVIKKSFVRAIIYVLISVLIASTLLLSLRFLTGFNSYTATINVSKSDDSLLSTFNRNKNLAVSNALDELGISSELASDVVRNTSITAQIPEDFDGEVYIPMVFDVTVKPNEKFNLSKSQYISLVDQITIEYVNIFSTAIFPTVISTYQKDGVGTNYDYLEYAEGIYNNINSAISSINVFISNSGIDRNRAEFADINILRAGLSDLLYSIEQLKRYIISNHVENSQSSINNYLELEYSLASADAKFYNQLVETAQAALKEYSAVISNITNGENSAGNIYHLNDQGFMNLINNLLHYQTLEATAIERIEMIEAYKKLALTSTSNITSKDAIAHTLSQLNEITTNFDSLLENYYEIEKKYNSNKTLTSTAQVTVPASQIYDSAISITLILIVDILIALIAYLVAIAKTFTSMKKNGTLYEKTIQE